MLLFKKKTSFFFNKIILNFNIMKQIKKSTSFNWEEAFTGLMDTDGSIRISIIDREKKRARKSSSVQKPLAIPFGFDINFNITQSKSKQLFSFLTPYLQVVQTSERSRSRKGTLNTEERWSTPITSPLGQKISKTLETTQLKNPGKFNDFLLASLISNLLEKKMQTTKEGLATLVFLCYKGSSQQQQKSTVIKRKGIAEYLDKLSLTQEQLTLANDNANNLYKPISEKVLILKESLPFMKLNPDYIVGAHWGDGGLTVILSWSTTKPMSNKPVWTMSDSSEEYLKAFKFTLNGGQIKKQKGNSFQFVFNGRKRVGDYVLPLFENKPMPFYKKEQYERVAKAVRLLEKRPLTPISGREFLELIYDVSENSKRTKTKEELIEILDEYTAKKNKK